MLIIGAGPTGLYAAYYAGFRGFSVIVMDALPEPGGQITAMYPEKEIFDVGGFPAIKGRDLVDGLLEQANQFRPTYFLGEQAIDLVSDRTAVTVTSDAGTQVRAKTLLITSGIGSFKPRPIPIGEEWVGNGVVYFVPRLAEHAGNDIVIIGGGDSAFDWAWSLQPIANSVTLVHRRDQFRAHAAMVEKVRGAGVRLITSAEIAGARGDGALTEIDVKSKADGSIETLPAQSVVAALGFIANIGPLADWGLELEKRRILVDTTMATNIDRVYAAGDITAFPGKVPLISVGFGEAATAVNNAAPLIDPTHGVFPGHSSGESSG
ncbi:MAG: NAD(P)/FAD-dependent oxidoreductase [Actinobacteria bacterium]|nr:NAD(P)/FAD-dependent oxidoreductase [Actinomycetota bacterium]